jgi:hypothetical protein
MERMITRDPDQEQLKMPSHLLASSTWSTWRTARDGMLELSGIIEYILQLQSHSLDLYSFWKGISNTAKTYLRSGSSTPLRLA